jgi:alanyl aminopeptidase
VQSYLQAHAHKNANTHDFLQALGTASAKDVETMFSTFLDQPGVPLITATMDCQSTPSLHLKQQRYLPNGETDASQWQLPVCVRWGSTDTERACFVLDAPEATFTLPTQSCPSYLVPNVDMRGYYRSRMTEAQFDQLLSPAVSLSLVEQIGLLGDASALVSSGDLGPAVVLNKLPALIALNIPEVLSSTVGVSAGLEGPLVPADLRGAYQQFLQQSYGPTARDLGFSTRPAETQAIRELRPRVLALVGGPGNDTEIQKEARKLTDTWLATRSGVDPDMVRTVLNISARVGDAALFETIKTQALAETDRRRRGMLLDALGNFLDPALGLQALTLALSDQVDIREGFGLVFGPLNQEETRESAWGFIKEHIDALADKVPLAARSYIPYTGSVFCDQKHYDEVKAFFEPKVGAWIGGKHSLDQSLESIQICMATTARQAPGVRSFLTSRPGQVGP